MNKVTFLALDPSGTGTTGLFIFRRWNDYEITSFHSKEWTDHYQFIKEKIKGEEREETRIFIIYEDHYKIKNNFDIRKLVQLVTGIKILAFENNYLSRPITSFYKKINIARAIRGEIRGVEIKKEKGKKEKIYFRNQLINKHELDAILIFWTYWVKKKLEEWPWA